MPPSVIPILWRQLAAWVSPAVGTCCSTLNPPWTQRSSPGIRSSSRTTLVCQLAWSYLINKIAGVLESLGLLRLISSRLSNLRINWVQPSKASRLRRRFRRLSSGCHRQRTSMRFTRMIRLRGSSLVTSISTSLLTLTSPKRSTEPSKITKTKNFC